MSPVLNAFESVRPRATSTSDGRAAPPRVDLAPRQYRGYGAVITNRAAGAAQNAKSAAIRHGTLAPKAQPASAPVWPLTPWAAAGVEGAPPANGAVDTFDRGTRAAKAPVGVVHSPPAVGAVQGGFTPPGDLQAFVASKSVRDVADALGLSRGTAYNLQRGYWPQDARKLLAVWHAYKGRVAPQQTRWVLRRVSSSGNVGYGCRTWSAPALQARADQTVAVARIDDTRLLVQTIDLPAERFELMAL